ncbi:MAG TPA: hypothetical protein VIJ11_13535, partial [Galbitalea sp.]
MMRGAVVVGALVVVVGLSGCAPAALPAPHPTSSHVVAAPTPTPTTPPALSELVLSPDGLGPLRIGFPVPDQPLASAVVVWDPTKCGTTGAWISRYTDADATPESPTGGAFFFAVDTK